MRLESAAGLTLLLALGGCKAKQEPASASSSPTTSSGQASRSACGDEILADEGIGELRIGATVASVREKCSILRDTTVIAAEGMPARKLAIALSRDTVEAEIVSDRVWRIAVLSPRLRTADSLGVETSRARLLQLTNPRVMTGEGQLFAMSTEHCGMSFRLANTGPGALGRSVERGGLAGLPESTVVSEVLIFGCRKPQ